MSNIIQLVKLRNVVENSRNCDPYCEYCFHRFKTHRKLNKIAFFSNTGYDAYISNGKTSFTVRFEVINLSCNSRITQENRLYWKFLQKACGRTHLQHSSPWLLWEDLWSRYFVRPCQRSHQYQSFSQLNPPVATWKREMCIPGHHIKVSCVYFVFLNFHLVNFLGF